MFFLTILFSLLKIFDVGSLIRTGGLLLVFAFVFGQTGLFFCFFLPSGALLFTAGVFTATGALGYNIVVVCSILSIAALLGNITGYWIGRTTGPLLYKKKDTRFFKQRYLTAAATFYEKWGGIASAAALFFPVTRSFAPLVAGIVKMNFLRFVLFAFIGSIGWVSAFVLAGYLIGIVPALKEYISYIVIFIILVVTVPVIIGVIKKLKKVGK
jgi:membrane-associated protein